MTKAPNAKRLANSLALFVAHATPDEMIRFTNIVSENCDLTGGQYACRLKDAAFELAVIALRRAAVSR